MKTCSKTGLSKYGSMHEAKAVINHSARANLMKAEKCPHCNCLHIVEQTPDERKPKRAAELTQGVSGWVHVDVARINLETEKAFFLVVEPGQAIQSGWVPKSVIADADEYSAGDCDATLSIQEWFTRKAEV